MREAIDSVKSRRLYSQRVATVEPMFADLRHPKRLSPLSLRGRAKAPTQRQLYDLVRDVETMVRNR